MEYPNEVDEHPEAATLNDVLGTRRDMHNPSQFTKSLPASVARQSALKGGGSRRATMLPTGKEDSDQSISEDEDIDYNWTRNCVSIGIASDDKQGNIGILSQLETLKDVHKLGCTSMGTTETQERQNKLCVDDDVELPVFNNENHVSVASACNSDEEIGFFPVLDCICNSDEEIISDDEKLNVGSLKCERESTLSRASKHSEAFYFNDENFGCSLVCGISSDPINPANGRQQRVKHRCLLHFDRERGAIHSVVGGESSKCSISSQFPLNEELCTDPHIIEKNILGDSLFNMQENKIELTGNDMARSDLATELKSSERSMAELLDCFQEKKRLQLGNPMKLNNINETGVKNFSRRIVSTLGEGIAIDDNIPSSDDEETPQVLKAFVPKKTIADQFDEALGSATRNGGISLFSAPELHCSGLFVNLQRVILSEKESDQIFMNHMSKDTVLDGDKICIDVRILSSSLEAKMTICQCVLIKGEESFDRLHHPSLKKTNGGSTMTVIFNSRICTDVEFDKGDLIRIYSPWKEVHTKENDEVVLLSRYFSRIGSDQMTVSV
ncbi:hypothetical protein DM860_015500 [Cuscuta australis]|uniref:Uncharacterized protein n=1 Tax=Cuscuta australis TaxID=267555 RepID=A0A328DHU9_9ASTE|nr:hypothetical protein DM860_015500 [Cuscuta australis]